MVQLTQKQIIRFLKKGVMKRKQKQELIAGAVGINTKSEFAELLHAVLAIANDGLNSLRSAAASSETDEIAEWSGLSTENVNNESDKLRETVQRLYSRAFKHYLVVRESADESPNTPPRHLVRATKQSGATTHRRDCYLFRASTSRNRNRNRAAT